MENRLKNLSIKTKQSELPKFLPKNMKIIFSPEPSNQMQYETPLPVTPLFSEIKGTPIFTPKSNKLISGEYFPDLYNGNELCQIIENQTVSNYVNEETSQKTEKIKNGSTPENNCEKSHDKTNSQSDKETDNDQDCTLFIGDLTNNVNEELLFNTFSKNCDGVVSVDVKKDKVTNINLGYGFVTFKTSEFAQQAMKKMQKQKIDGRPIRINWAQKNTNLFICLVGDVEQRIDTKALQEIFSQFGPIDPSKTHRKNEYFGHIKFKYREHAAAAKKEYDNKKIFYKNYLTPREIRLGWDDVNAQKNCVHVKFDGKLGDYVFLEEKDLINIFSVFGKVVKVSLPRYKDKKLKGYGFVHYEENNIGEIYAAQAVTTYNNLVIKNSLQIKCNFSKRQNPRHKKFQSNKKTTVVLNGNGTYKRTDGKNEQYYNFQNGSLNQKFPTKNLPNFFFSKQTVPVTYYNNLAFQNNLFVNSLNQNILGSYL